MTTISTEGSRKSVFALIPPAVVSTLVSLAIWQLAATVGPISESSIPTATATVATLAAMMFEGETYALIGETFVMAGIGFLLSVVIAVPAGFAIGLSRFAYRSTKFTFDFFKVIPPIVLIPITILVLGPSMQMGIFLIVFTNVFALAIQTSYGVRDTDPVLLETLRLYRLGLAKQILYARLPTALPFIAVGLRLAAAASLIVAVVAGLLGGAPGLGNAILTSQSSGNSERTFAIVLLLGVLGVAVSRVIQWSQARIVFWESR